MALYKEVAEAAKSGYRRAVKAAPKGESLDLWHWKEVQTNFADPLQLDDQFIGDFMDVERFVDASRSSDAGGGGYFDNVRDFKLADGTTVKAPKYGYLGGDTNGYIKTQQLIDFSRAVEMTDARVMSLPEGAHIPRVIGRTFTGSRGDITGTGVWSNGRYRP